MGDLLWSQTRAQPRRTHPSNGLARVALLFLFTTIFGTPLAAQFDTLPPPNALKAVGQTVVVNTLVNRLDVWLRNRPWARVGTRVWANNIRLGWAWDEDAFATNVFAHPYHGGIYFNAGRANGLDFFESVPVTIFGSWSWEYFGETERPSLNDFLMSTMGGIALGEMFHRIGTSIRDNEARGTGRTLRELAAMPFDPMGGLNRLVRGQWSGVGRNPVEHDPQAYVLRVGAGVRFAKGLVHDSVARMGAAVVDLLYGDQFAGTYRTPFDVFSIRLVLTSHGGLNALRASGRLYGLDLNDSTARIRHQLAVNQRYDYVNNPAQSVGGQSVEIGINSRWRLGSRGFGLRTSFFADGIILGAIDAPGAGVGLRTYDFGPGAGVRWEVAADKHGARFLVLYGRVEYIHTVSGTAADHVVNLSGIELAIPVTNRLGIAAQTYIFDRESHYLDRAPDRRDYPEGRLLLVWTRATNKP
jgi:hypothetical protein